MSARFDADWLSLRETVDHRARSAELLSWLGRNLPSRNPLRILDLGAGTGSNLRYVAPRLGMPQHWTLIDHDAGLLARVGSPPNSVEPVHCRSVCTDLAQWQMHADPAPDLVTASALIDLVSEAWLESFVDTCRKLSVGICIALSYDGTVHWSAPDPVDASALAVVNTHQRRDKGLGSAAGPGACAALARMLAAANYTVRIEPSPWILGPESATLVDLLVDGWVKAACEQDPANRADYLRWGLCRRADFRAGRTRLQVGHLDLAAVPEPRA